MKTRTDKNRLPERLLSDFKKYKNLLKKSRARPSEKNIHQFRIQTQKLSASLLIATWITHNGRIKNLTKQLNKIRRKTSALRDVHVQVVEMKRWNQKQTAFFQKYLLKLQSKKENKVRRQLKNSKQKFDIKAVARLLLNSKISDVRIKNYVATLERKLKVQAADSKILHPQHLHQFRLAVKRFRYVEETLAEISSPKNARPLRWIRMQKTLGRFQNTISLQERIKKYQKTHNKSAREQLSFLNVQTQAKHKKLLNEIKSLLKTISQ